MADYIKYGLTASLACTVLTVLLFVGMLLAAVSPIPNYVFFIGFVAFAVLGGLIGLAVMVLALLEIYRAKNESSWKWIWGAIVFFFGMLGAAAYYLVARKELK